MSAVPAVKYGRVTSLGRPMRLPFAASQIFHRRGAAFVTVDASGYVTAGAAADTALFGWWEVPGFSPGASEVSGSIFTTSSTAGTDYQGVVPAVPGEQYRVPTDAALTETMFGQACDIVVSSNQMLADVGTSTTDVLLILGKGEFIDAGLSEAIVTINPAKVQALT